MHCSTHFFENHRFNTAFELMHRIPSSYTKKILYNNYINAALSSNFSTFKVSVTSVFITELLYFSIEHHNKNAAYSLLERIPDSRTKKNYTSILELYFLMSLKCFQKTFS